jgi:hypothetical protein
MPIYGCSMTIIIWARCHGNGGDYNDNSCVTLLRVLITRHSCMHGLLEQLVLLIVAKHWYSRNSQG